MAACIRRISKQLAAGLLPIFLFVVLSITLNGDKWQYTSRFSIIFIGISVVWLCACIYSCVCGIKAWDSGKIKTFMYDNRWMLVILAVIVLVRLPFINLLQRWDAGEYYYRIGLAYDDFTYSTFEEFFSLYGLCGHSASLFTMICMIGEFIFPRRIVGVSIVSIILTALAMWCIYKIIIKMTATASNTVCAVYTLLISVAPLVYTFTTHINLDYVMAMFVVIIIYCYMYDKPVLAGIMCIYCFQTKENGLVIVAGIALGEIVRHILVDRGKSPKTIFTDSKLYITLITALMQWGYFRRYGNNWTATGEQEAGGMFKWDSNGSECLGLNPSYMLMKFKQQFILNFNWIAALIIIAGVIYIIANRKRLKECGSGMYAVCIMTGALITHSMFSYLYITGTCTRYNIISDILLYLIAIYVIEKARDIHRCKADGADRTVICRIAVGCWVAILSIECFITIDPLSLLAFQRVDSVNMDSLLMTRITDEVTYGESLIHNTQYHCYDKAMDELLAEVDFDPDTTDIVLYNDGGVFISGNVPLYYLNWDCTKKKRVFYENGNTKQMPGYYGIEWFDKKTLASTDAGKLKDKAVFVVCTYFVNIDVDMDSAVKELSRFYDVSERRTASTWQGGVYYYEMTLKK